MNSIQMTLAVLCFVAALALARANPVAVDLDDEMEGVPNDPLPMGEDGSLFLAARECGPNEELHPGALPTCEPTCKVPRPMCPKIFITIPDFVPCFCKKPLIRNERTGACVRRRECPK